MYVTREADYAVRCVLCLASDRMSILSAREVARRMQIPPLFLSKILQRLVHAGIVRSVRGARGGFTLQADPSALSLLAVIEAIQGPSAANPCAIDHRKCRLSRSCPIHPVWVEIRRDIDKRLKRETFERLARRLRGTKSGAKPPSPRRGG